MRMYLLSLSCTSSPCFIEKNPANRSCDRYWVFNYIKVFKPIAAAAMFNAKVAPGEFLPSSFTLEVTDTSLSSEAASSTSSTSFATCTAESLSSASITSSIESANTAETSNASSDMSSSSTSVSAPTSSTLSQLRSPIPSPTAPEKIEHKESPASKEETEKGRGVRVDMGRPPTESENGGTTTKEKEKGNEKKSHRRHLHHHRGRH